MEQNQQKAVELTELYATTSGGLLSQWKVMIKRLRAYRFLVRQLIKVNLHTAFKRSFIGLSWLVILPLLSVVIWILMNKAGIMEPGDVGIPYPAFVLLSTSIWGFFVEIYRSTSKMIESNGRMLIMTPFPHETLLAEQIIVHFIRFSIPFALNLIVLLLFGVKFTAWALLFPLTLLPLLLLGVAIGLLTALLRIVAIDLSNLMDEGMKLLMFLTPIVYAPKLQLGFLSEIVAVNPLTYLVSFSRDVLTKGTFYEPINYLYCVIFVLLSFWLSYRLYRVAQPRVIERLISA